MKKIKLLLISILMLGLVGCSKYTEYHQINYDELMQKLNNKDSFVLVLGYEQCSACAKYKETMKSVIKDNNLEIFFIDIHAGTEEEYSKIYSQFVITATPTTIFIVDGKEKSTYDRIVGAASYSEVINSLKQYGYVEK